MGGVTAVLAVGLAPWAWQVTRQGAGPIAMGRANAAYLAATDLLEHAYRPGSAAQAVRILEPLRAGPDATALIHAALGRAYFRMFRETKEAEWLE